MKKAIFSKTYSGFYALYLRESTVNDKKGHKYAHYPF